jgi:hypothetical protein
MSPSFGAWHPTYACHCAAGPSFPAHEVEAARVRVLKRRIARRVAAMLAARTPALALVLRGTR